MSLIRVGIKSNIQVYIHWSIFLVIIGSCAAAGYTKCCSPTDTDQCFGHPETCHCDVICHEYGDCCEDVIDIGCYAVTGSCAAAGHTSCCLSDDPDCSGIPANCMCDQGCFQRGDCCSDVSQLSNCQVEPDKGKKLKLYTTSVYKYYWLWFYSSNRCK